MAKDHTELTAAEISNLWTSYLNDSMAVCGIRYYLRHIDDDDIKRVLEYALSISEEHVRRVTKLLKAEDYTIPFGFTEEDVNLEAPRLFTDTFYLLYILNMGKFGLSSYSLALSLSVREDIVEYYTDCLEETTKLHNDSKEVAIRKGMMIPPPVIPKPAGVDHVERQSFLRGYFGHRRPLLGVEIANLHYNSERNALGQAVIIGFSQVAKNKEVRSYFERGRDLSKKHYQVFNSLLEEEFLSGTLSLAPEVTDSKISPFSDKLMMYHIAALSASGIGQYGISMSSSPRHDLGVLYSRLTAEILHYSEDGANIMIDHGWMEQPPKASDRENLARKKTK
ncbi:DUF3231 family protein [Bacillus sp. Marseille-Q1617]|uniref:DUF3231 family protein n=1 Tax=Bacillus sp. Marseille-Q1617 TaxID=2736887 RepID=UPI00158AB3B9|nr:DUF3231 family protein [Bacillus sp. Marseille-Q1617]